MEYAESVIPGATHVNLESKTLLQDIIDKLPDIKKAPATAKPTAKSLGSSGKPLVERTMKQMDRMANIFKRDVRLGRLGRAGKLGLLATPAVLSAGYGINRLFGKRKPQEPAQPTEPIPAPVQPDWQSAVSKYAPYAAGAAALGGLAALLADRRKKKRRKNRDD
jgi:hypothetical protein